MNVIRASLSTDVYNRTGIAPVFRAEVVRYDLIFIDEMWIGKSQTRSANRIVVIVLAIDLLVVVLVTVTVSFVPLFTIFINALGTDAPWGSTTLPETEPLDTCAYAICWLTNDGTNMITPATNNAKHR